MTMELGGKVTIDCEKTNHRAELEFKLKPFFGGSASINQISGKIKSGEEVLASLNGHWDGEVHINELKNGNAEMFWNPTSEVRRQRLKRHIVLFEEQTDFESERLWQHVTSAINKGDQHKATQEKFVLEEEQRNAARERKENGTEWKPLLFQHDATTNEWRYKYEDLRPWDPLNDIAQFEKNGSLRFDSDRVSFNPCFIQRSAKDCRRRKTSDQPSNHSQNTESSCSTPESVQELSDDDGEYLGFESLCAQCGKEMNHLKEIHSAVLSLQRAQQDIHRNLSALNKKSFHRKVSSESFLLDSRCWFLLCIFLTCQLFINYVFK
uniref:Oxysterol-binding protein n=1 Tax=Strix occidentalis caurina TaxID=311401 RepID=A0A8D0EQT2_STROC